ncbi:MAG: DUF3592 domain-containing protein [Synechococcus sp.]|nr:DUF3592 domain-containing protein [Synechococcus sp.]
MNPIALVSGVFTLIGAGMLWGTALLWSSTSTFLSEAIPAPGTVVDLVAHRSSDSTTYRPAVDFTSRNGEPVSFVSSTGSSPPSYSVGQRVEVLYRPTNPRDARINDFFSLWGGATVLGGMGFIFAGVGVATMVGMVLGRRGEEQLRQNGVAIYTDFQQVALNTSLTVNGRHPFQIFTQWLDRTTGQVHGFRSRNLWFDPSPFIPEGKITVYLREGNPKRYVMDVSFLPNQKN